MTEQTMDQPEHPSRKGVRRTVTILASIALAFFLLSFLQILLMK
jgi:hypothetical protein